MSDGPDIPESSDRRLNRAVAASVVILSVAMALTHIKDDNIVQAMQASQAAQIDLWNEYQATRLKLHMEEIATADRARADPGAAAAIARYTREAADLKAKALGAKADYDAAGYRDDQFDLADGFASIALAVTAIAALVTSWRLLWFGWGSAAMALLFSIAGFARLPLHPDLVIGWLTRSQTGRGSIGLSRSVSWRAGPVTRWCDPPSPCRSRRPASRR